MKLQRVNYRDVKRGFHLLRNVLKTVFASKISEQLENVGTGTENRFRNWRKNASSSSSSSSGAENKYL